MALTQWKHQRMSSFGTPCSRMDICRTIIHPYVIFIRPSIIMYLKIDIFKAVSLQQMLFLFVCSTDLNVGAYIIQTYKKIFLHKFFENDLRIHNRIILPVTGGSKHRQLWLHESELDFVYQLLPISFPVEMKRC